MDLGFGIWDFGFWILDFGSWILDFGFWISDFGFWILDFGFWILDFGFWILDFGFWIVVVSVLFVAAPNAAVWILDLGFWILDFGFWILGTVWILHKIIATTRRLGSADFGAFRDSIVLFVFGYRAIKFVNLSINNHWA